MSQGYDRGHAIETFTLDGAGKPIEIRRSRCAYDAPCAGFHKEAQHRLLEHNFGKLDGYMQATPTPA